MSMKLYFAVFLTALVSSFVGKYIPTLNLGLPYGLETPVIGAVAATVIFAVIHKLLFRY